MRFFSCYIAVVLCETEGEGEMEDVHDLKTYMKFIIRKYNIFHLYHAIEISEMDIKQL